MNLLRPASCRRPWFAALIALLLVFAQPAALAHMVGHLGLGQETALQQEEGGHGAALSLSHTCTTCIVVAGALAGPPPALPVLPTRAATPVWVPALAVPALSAAGYAPWQARAPPVFL